MEERRIGRGEGKHEREEERKGYEIRVGASMAS
jgi:hypothetical protein